MPRHLLLKRWWFVFVTIAAMILLGRSGTHAADHGLPAGLTAPPQPLSMPDCRLPRVDGTTLSAADLRGKVVLMRFWSTW